MMLAERVLETSTTTGTGAYALAGPPADFRGFVSTFGAGTKVTYFVLGETSKDFERALGTLSAGPDTLTRDAILESSNAGSAVNWGAETKTIFVSAPMAVVDSLLKSNSAGARPAWLPANGMWLDTSVSPYVLRWFDGAQDLPIVQLDPAGNTSIPYRAGALLGTAATVPIKAGGTEAAATNVNNNFTATQTFQSNDSGSVDGPFVSLFRNSASPAGADYIGIVEFLGNNSVGAQTQYAAVLGNIINPASGAEDGAVHLKSLVVGVPKIPLIAYNGVQIGAPTGGDKGAGSLNTQSLWVQGVQVDTASPTDGQALAYSSGAGKWQPTTISTTPPAGSVGQTELDTSEALQTTTSGTWTHITLTGGEYGFWPRFSGGGGGNQVFARPAEGHNVANYISRVAMYSSSGATAVGVTQRYVNASPPFDLGDGEVAGFIFAFVDAGGNVVGLSIADAPPWAYNGPTSLRPHKIEGGKKYRRVLRDSDLGRFLGGEIGLDAWRAARGGAEAGWAAARADAARALADSIDAESALAAEIAEAQAGLQRAAARAMRDSWAAQLALKETAARDARAARLAAEDAAKIDPAFDWVEIDQAMKNADMGLLPHDRTGNDLTGVTAVLIDPMDPAVKYLIDAQSAGEDVAPLFHGGRLKIDNTPLTRAGPPGVLVCAMKE